MKFTIVTLFPEMFQGPFDFSIIKRAQLKGILDISFINIRDFSTDNYKTVDDRPYGGDQGMILRVDIVDKAIQEAKKQYSNKTIKQLSILLDPRGKTYTQQKAHTFATYDHIILVCGHYEGFDERIRTLVDEELSIGDYVLTGGEIPAVIIVDSVARLLKGTLKNDTAFQNESFQHGLEYPQYTRPPVYNGLPVPEILLSGDPKKIKTWQTEQSKMLTKSLRPDLVEKTN